MRWIVATVDNSCIIKMLFKYQKFSSKIEGKTVT